MCEEVCEGSWRLHLHATCWVHVRSAPGAKRKTSTQRTGAKSPWSRHRDRREAPFPPARWEAPWFVGHWVQDSGGDPLSLED